MCFGFLKCLSYSEMILWCFPVLRRDVASHCDVDVITNLLFVSLVETCLDVCSTLLFDCSVGVCWSKDWPGKAVSCGKITCEVEPCG